MLVMLDIEMLSILNRATCTIFLQRNSYFELTLEKKLYGELFHHCPLQWNDCDIVSLFLLLTQQFHNVMFHVHFSVTHFKQGSVFDNPLFMGYAKRCAGISQHD